MSVINIRMVNHKRPDFDVYIGRELNFPKALFARSKWANPFPVKYYGHESLTLYEEYVRSHPTLMRELPELKGKVLGCWCKPKPCHGDVLLKLLKELEDE